MNRSSPAAAGTAPPAPGAGPAELTNLSSLRLTPALCLCLLGCVGALYVARSFFVPLLIGMLASYTLYPLVDALARLRIPRVLGAGLVLAGVLALLGGAAVMVQDDAAQFVDDLPQAARKLRERLSAPPHGGNVMQKLGRAADELQRLAADAAGTAASRPAAPGWVRDYLAAQSALFLAVVSQAPFVLLLTFFLLASGEHFRRKLVQLAGPTLGRRKVTLQILNDIDAQVQRYMAVLLATNALVALGTWLGFLALGLAAPGLWGMAAGLLHFIPYAGPLVIALASGVAGFLQFNSLWLGLAAAGISLLVATLAGMLFMTWLQSRFSNTHPAALFIALLFFGWMWGAWGLLLGAPLVAIAKVICDHVDDLHPVAELLGP